MLQRYTDINPMIPGDGLDNDGDGWIDEDVIYRQGVGTNTINVACT